MFFSCIRSSKINQAGSPRSVRLNSTGESICTAMTGNRCELRAVKVKIEAKHPWRMKMSLIISDERLQKGFCESHSKAVSF